MPRDLQPEGSGNLLHCVLALLLLQVAAGCDPLPHRGRIKNLGVIRAMPPPDGPGYFCETYRQWTCIAGICWLCKDRNQDGSLEPDEPTPEWLVDDADRRTFDPKPCLQDGCAELWTARCTSDTQYRVCGVDTDVWCFVEGDPIECSKGTYCYNGRCMGGDDCEPPEVMLLVDRSGTMDGYKWVGIRDEIESFVRKYDAHIRFGIRLLPHETSCGVSEPVAPQLYASETIAAVLTNLSAEFSTPIAAGLTGLQSMFTDAGHHQDVILMTDGGETCATDGAAAKEVLKLRQYDVKTYTVGIGSGYKSIFLDALAVVGGTSHHYDGSDKGRLKAALEAIVEAMLPRCVGM